MIVKYQRPNRKIRYVVAPSPDKMVQEYREVYVNDSTFEASFATTTVDLEALDEFMYNIGGWKPCRDE